MPHSPSQFPVTIKLYWPIRISVHPFESVFSFNGDNINIQISFETSQEVENNISIPVTNFTCITINYFQKFQGDSSQFERWCAGDNGKKQILDTGFSIQSYLTTWIKMTNPYNYNLSALSHYGPADIPFILLKYNSIVILKNAHPLYLSQSFPSIDLSIAQNHTLDDHNSTYRFIIRATELADSGYPTEALLLTVSCLDSHLQNALENGMRNLGISENSATTQLRNITQSRFATYLDPLFKLIFDVSLKDENNDLFTRILSVNQLRNRAIHSGIDVSRKECMDSIETIYHTLEFINQYSTSQIELPPAPIFYKVE